MRIVDLIRAAEGIFRYAGTEVPSHPRREEERQIRSDRFYIRGIHVSLFACPPEGYGKLGDELLGREVICHFIIFGITPFESYFNVTDPYRNM